MDKVILFILNRKFFNSIFLIMVILILVSCNTKDLYSQIFDYCRSHEEIKLAEITNFDWDIAYLDRNPYSSGKEIKEKYGIEGEFQPLPTDFSSRVAFCKDGKLVYDLELNNFYFEFDTSNEIIKPDSVFSVTWVSIPDQKDKKLFLR